MKRVFYVLFFFALTSHIFAQVEDNGIDTSADSTENQSDKLNEAIYNGDCDYLYNWMQNESYKNSYQYSRIKDIVDDYRKPNTITSRFHTGRMENIINTVPSDIKQMIFDVPEKTLPELVEYLTKGTQSQFQVVKNLHDWICNNIAYDAEMFFSGNIQNQDYVSVLKAKKAVCAGYSNLFKEMCELAGLEANVIHGYSKGFGYNGKVSEVPDHDWNSVRIGNKWYLVDSTWDAGILEGKMFIKQYSTEYLFLESSAFMFTHLPEDNKYQYYAPSKSKEQFEAEPKITGKFFEAGFLYSDELPTENLKLSYAKIIEMPFANANPAPIIEIMNKSSGKKVNTIWSENVGGKIKVEIDVPDTSEYQVVIRQRDTKKLKFPRFFYKAEYEANIKKINEYIDDGTLQFEDASYFQDSYFKVEENDKYYFRENQFDTLRYSSLRKTFEVLQIPSGDELFSFTVQTEGDYKGYGSENKYPYVHDEYYDTKSTFLVSPKKATLTADKEIKFSVKTRDFLYVVLIVGDETIPLSKNSLTGNYECIHKNDGSPITIAASREKRNYISLWTLNMNDEN